MTHEHTRFLRVAGYLAALVFGLGFLAGCRSSESGPPSLGTIRLFYVDSANGWIVEINPKTGIIRNFFPVPDPPASAAGCGMAFNSGAGILYFLDPGDPQTIYRILPEASSPGLVSAAALPTPAVFPYEGLGWDGKHLTALDSNAEFIDALDPGTGQIVESTGYPVDLGGGLDTSRKRGIYVGGLDTTSGNQVIYHLGSQGQVLDVIPMEPTLDPQGIAIAKSFLFVADGGTSKIRIFKITRKKKAVVLKPIAEIPYPPGSNVSALAAGLD